MAQLSTSHTFNDGDVVHGSDLNNIVGQAVALPGIITEQTAISSPVPASDLVLVWSSAASALRKQLVSALPSGVSAVSVALSNGATVLNFTVTTPTTTPTISLGFDNQTAGKVFAGPVSGGAAVPSFRLLNPADLPSSTVPVGALAIDWSLGNCFSKSLPTSGTIGPMTFSNASEGQTITVLIAQGGTANITFPPGAGGVYWAGPTVYAATIGAGAHDVLIFRFINGHYWGNYLLNFGHF